MSYLISLSTGGLPTRFFVLNVQNRLINSLCYRRTVSGLTIEILSLIVHILIRIEKMNRSDWCIFNRFFWFCLLRISISFFCKQFWIESCFFDSNRLKNAPIRKVINENILPPENQKYRFSGMNSSTDVINPPHGKWSKKRRKKQNHVTRLNYRA